VVTVSSKSVLMSSSRASLFDASEAAGVSISGHGELPTHAVQLIVKHVGVQASAAFAGDRRLPAGWRAGRRRAGTGPGSIRGCSPGNCPRSSRHRHSSRMSWWSGIRRNCRAHPPKPEDTSPAAPGGGSQGWPVRAVQIRRSRPRSVVSVAMALFDQLPINQIRARLRLYIVVLWVNHYNM